MTKSPQTVTNQDKRCRFSRVASPWPDRPTFAWLVKSSPDLMDELVAVHGAIGALGEKLQNVELAARKTRVVSFRHCQLANELSKSRSPKWATKEGLVM